MAGPVDAAEVALSNLCPEKRAELEALFSVYDQDNDGNLTLYEISGVLHKLGTSPSIPELRAMIREVDKDKNGLVSKHEFLRTMALRSSHSSKITEEQIDSAFKAFDTDKDGFISKKELESCFKKLDLKPSHYHLRKMLREADVNRDGRISHKEFRKVMKKQSDSNSWKGVRDMAFFNSLLKPITSDPKEREREKERAKAEGRILKQIVFVRHGESMSNWESDQGFPDLFHWEPHLTDLGVSQAKGAAGEVKKELENHKLKLELIVVSPLYRAVQTAQLVFEEQIADKTTFVGHPLATEMVTASDDVGDAPANIRKKWSLPDWSLLPDKEVWWYIPKEYQPTPTTVEAARAAYKANPIEEPWERVVARGAQLESWLAARPEDVIAVVAHGDFIEAIAGQDLDNAKFFTMDIEARSLSQLVPPAV